MLKSTYFLFFVFLQTCLYSQVTQQWAQVYNGTGNTDEFLDYWDNSQSVTDGNGFVYSTGFVNNGTNLDLFIRKTNSSGTVMWTNTYNGAGGGRDGGHSIAVDGSGNVYVVGEACITSGSEDFILIKYNSSGVQQWVQTYDLTNATVYGDRAYDIRLDGSGNAYICGVTYMSATFHYSTLKYNSSGTFQWISTYSGLSNYYGYPNHLLLDGSGNVYMSAQRYQTITTDDIVLVKYNNSGAQQFTVAYNGTANGRDYAYAMADDGSGIVLTGSENELSNANFITLKYNYSGAFQWAQSYNGSSNQGDVAWAISVDSFGNTIVTGESNSRTQIRTIKYNSFGTQQWTQGYSSAGTFHFAQDIAVDGDGSVYITGACNTSINNDLLAIKYNSAGALQWDTTYAGSGNGRDHGNSINIDQGTVYVFGIARNTNDDLVLLKYCQVPAVAVSPTNAMICSGSSATLTASGVYSYSWDPGSTTGVSLVVTPSITTSYTLHGYSPAGCNEQNVKTITVNPLPTITVNSGTICAGRTFTIVPSGSANYFITGGNFVVSPLATTNYSVTGTSTVGCASSNTAVASVTVHQLPVISVNSGTICSGSIFTIVPAGASSYSITGNSNTVSPQFHSSYFVTGTSSLGCVSSNTATSNVTVIPLPIVNINGPGTICIGSSATLTATGASGYIWDNNANTSTISVSPTNNTSYSVTGTNTAGCKNVALTTVTVNPLPNVSANASSTGVCLGNPVTLNGGGGVNYLWSGGVTNNSAFSPTATTIYTVTGTDGNNCSASAQVSVTVNSLPSLTVTSGNSVICAGESITLFASGASNYQWNTGENTSSIVITPSVTTQYTITGTDTNGCAGKAVVQQFVDACLEVGQLISQQLKFVVYPNPNNGEFSLRFDRLPENTYVHLFDNIGRTIAQIKIENEQTALNMTQSEIGIYFMAVVVNGKRTFQEKIIITGNR